MREILREAVGELLDDADLLLDQAAPVFGQKTEQPCFRSVLLQGEEAVAVVAEQIQQQ